MLNNINYTGEDYIMGINRQLISDARKFMGNMAKIIEECDRDIKQLEGPANKPSPEVLPLVRHAKHLQGLTEGSDRANAALQMSEVANTRAAAINVGQDLEVIARFSGASGNSNDKGDALREAAQHLLGKPGYTAEAVIFERVQDFVTEYRADLKRMAAPVSEQAPHRGS